MGRSGEGLSAVASSEVRDNVKSLPSISALRSSDAPASTDRRRSKLRIEPSEHPTSKAGAEVEACPISPTPSRGRSAHLRKIEYIATLRSLRNWSNGNDSASRSPPRHEGTLRASTGVIAPSQPPRLKSLLVKWSGTLRNCRETLFSWAGKTGGALSMKEDRGTHRPDADELPTQKGPLRQLGLVVALLLGGTLNACTSALDYCGKACGLNAPCATGYSCDSFTSTCVAADGHCSTVTGGAASGSGSTGSSGGGSGAASSSSGGGGTSIVVVGSLATLGVGPVTGTMQLVDQGLETTAQTCQANLCLNGGLTP